MHIAYIDDSRDERFCAFTALLINIERWQDCFHQVKDFRKSLKEVHDISVHSELHAWKFVSGRGRLGTNRVVPKEVRCTIFNQTLAMTASLPEAQLISVLLNAEKENWAFERLLNRINRNMEVNNSHCILMCDEGKDAVYTRLCRRMGVFNPIPSKFGKWKDGKPYKNLTVDRIIEDPIFKDSKKSYLIQLADFCAYALLRQENQLASKNALGIHKAFRLLEPICVKEANKSDPCRLGIVR